MANLMSKRNHLKTKYRTFLIASVACYALAILCWLSHVPLMKPYITMPGMLFSFILGGFFTQKYKKLQSGVEGEAKTIDLLSRLPKDCYVFNDIEIEVDGKKGEMDSVVVSPNGVVIIETKNHKGEIEGKVEDQYWVQRKVGKGGTPYEKRFYSPVKQVKTHTWKLSQYFKKHGINAWIDSAVYFSNEDAVVNIFGLSESQVPVYSYYESDDLIDFVTMKKKKTLSESEIQKIVALLKKQ